MKKIATIFALLIMLVIAINNMPQKELASVEKINNKLVILFKENCEYSAISLNDINNESISEVVFSENPGNGPILKKNTYLDI